ncbi:MAG: ATP-grasp domain-containing protein [Burkholderiales bacterium]|nr:ATP-grasp domain-containing protein [Burkholderiales bacterium]
MTRSLVLFNYDWDVTGFGALAGLHPHDSRGFDLFSFPSNARLAWFDMERYVARLARGARRRGWGAVMSNHEQFGALAAALLAERMGWPGTPVAAVLACQHKLHARQVLQQVAPEANLRFAPLDAVYGGPVPEGLAYPLFVKPVKAAFSVLARTVADHADLHHHTRFGAWELWVIRHLVEPFERIAARRLPAAGTAHRMMIEEPVQAPQFNLDGYVFRGEVREIGFVDAVMYPRTQCFMRFQLPSTLPEAVRARALDVARRFLGAVGFDHGIFNMEFFYDAATDRLTVIEFNPRMASQFADLYRRVLGVDMHHIAIELAYGRDPAALPRALPSAGAAASLVYRVFPGEAVPAMPARGERSRFEARFPDALLFEFPKDRKQIERDFKWLSSYRYGIVHLGGRDADDLRRRADKASAMLGWVAPFETVQHHAPEPSRRPAFLPAISGESYP